MSNVYNISVGKHEGKESLGRLRRRWEESIIMDLRETGSEIWTGFMWFRTGTSGGLL
jgi:hypothetical protein